MMASWNKNLPTFTEAEAEAADNELTASQRRHEVLVDSILSVAEQMRTIAMSNLSACDMKRQVFETDKEKMELLSTEEAAYHDVVEEQEKEAKKLRRRGYGGM